MPVCNYCGERHVIYAEWAACNSRRNASDLRDSVVFVCDGCGQWDDHADTCMSMTGRYIDVPAIDYEEDPSEYFNPIDQGMYDDDPNPYHGTYSEE